MTWLRSWLRRGGQGLAQARVDRQQIIHPHQRQGTQHRRRAHHQPQLGFVRGSLLVGPYQHADARRVAKPGGRHVGDDHPDAGAIPWAGRQLHRGPGFRRARAHRAGLGPARLRGAATERPSPNSHNTRRRHIVTPGTSGLPAATTFTADRSPTIGHFQPRTGPRQAAAPENVTAQILPIWRSTSAICPSKAATHSG